MKKKLLLSKIYGAPDPWHSVRLVKQWLALKGLNVLNKTEYKKNMSIYQISCKFSFTSTFLLHPAELGKYFI